MCLLFLFLTEQCCLWPIAYPGLHHYSVPPLDFPQLLPWFRFFFPTELDCDLLCSYSLFVAFSFLDGLERKFQVLHCFASVKVATLSDPFQYFPVGNVALFAGCCHLCRSCGVCLPRALHQAGSPQMLMLITYEKEQAPFVICLSFVFWKHRPEARGSVKTLFCRTAVFQRRRETRMRSC